MRPSKIYECPIESQTIQEYLTLWDHQRLEEECLRLSSKSILGWPRWWPLWHSPVNTHNSTLQKLEEACPANIWTNFDFFSIDIDLLCESTGCKPGENFLICVDLKKPFKWISRSLQSCSWSTLRRPWFQSPSLQVVGVNWRHQQATHQ